MVKRETATKLEGGCCLSYLQTTDRLLKSRKLLGLVEIADPSADYGEERNYLILDLFKLTENKHRAKTECAGKITRRHETMIQRGITEKEG